MCGIAACCHGDGNEDADEDEAEHSRFRELSNEELMEKVREEARRTPGMSVPL